MTVHNKLNESPGLVENEKTQKDNTNGELKNGLNKRKRNKKNDADLAESFEFNDVQNESDPVHKIINDIKCINWDNIPETNDTNQTHINEKLISSVASNIILEIASNNPYFIEQGKLVVLDRGFDKPVLFVINDTWLYPFRLFRNTDKDKLVVSQDSLQKFEVVYEEPISHYLIRQFSPRQLSNKSIDLYTKDWLKEFSQTFGWEYIYIQLLKGNQEIQKQHSQRKPLSSTEFSYLIAKSLLIEAKAVLPAKWMQKHEKDINVVAIGYKSNVINFCVKIGDVYLDKFSKNQTIFKITGADKKEKVILLTMGLDSFLDSYKQKE